MGVDYSAVLYVGKEFENQSEAKDFYERFFTLSEGEQQFIEDESFSEFCYGLDSGLSGETLNRYNGYGFIFGIDIGSSIRKPEQFAESVSNAIAKWKELILDVEPEIIHTVRIW